ncbi:MAG TPA: histidine kinase [Pseudomonadales bacterium]|nr:histidine kinase [Pseudomonadales bacterium]HMW82657.1 histidine kinase [Pseudomonadales bacterium]HMY95866.1 histidine kinase [Pseudomonadales bacterium]HMZ71678.1 histidine kinase [Pseudomonadales bacterium]HNC77386.1 histidine kinase [Pseudomonadales bacterium]
MHRTTAKRPATAHPLPTSVESGLVPDFSRVGPLLFLLLLCELLVIVLVLAASGVRQFDWQMLALWSLQVEWIALTSALLISRLRARLLRLEPAAAVSALYLLVLAVVMVVTLCGQWFTTWAVAETTDWFDPYALATALVIGAITTGVALRYLYLSDRLRVEQQAALTARLDALQARIRPHFLFNSLNSIAALISIDPLAAEELLVDLSELFRATLKEGERLVPLTREIELCQRYLAIEQRRLGERLRVVWQLAPHPDSARLPPLTLQPLLENAIYHGVQPLLDGGEIHIRLSRQGERIEIEITNPLPAASAASEGHRIGLTNTRARLRNCFGDRAEVQGSATDGGYRTLLSFPDQI